MGRDHHPRTLLELASHVNINVFNVATVPLPRAQTKTKTIFWVANVPLLQHVKKGLPVTLGRNRETRPAHSRNPTSESLSRPAVSAACTRPALLSLANLPNINSHGPRRRRGRPNLCRNSVSLSLSLSLLSSLNISYPPSSSRHVPRSVILPRYNFQFRSQSENHGFGYIFQFHRGRLGRLQRQVRRGHPKAARRLPDLPRVLQDDRHVGRLQVSRAEAGRDGDLLRRCWKKWEPFPKRCTILLIIQ